MNICLICLRTDRRLKLSTGLSEFHDELIMFGFSLLAANPRYCRECECLLAKFYKFKQKCLKAAETYRAWMSGEIKDPIGDLHKLLPPSPLGVWEPGKRIAYFNLQSLTPDLVEMNFSSTLQELIKNAHIDDVKMEKDTQDNSTINIDVQKEIAPNNVSNDIDDEKKPITEHVLENLELIQNDFDCEDFPDFGVASDSDTKTEVPEDVKKKKACNKRVSKCLKKTKVTRKKREDLSDFDVASDSDTKTEVPEDVKKRKACNKRVSKCLKKPKVTRKKREDSSDSNVASESDTKTEVDIKKRKVTCNKKVSKCLKKTKVTGKKKETNAKKNTKKTIEEDIISKDEVLPVDGSEEELIQRLCSFGELVTGDGVVVDKELMVNCLRRDPAAPVVRRLWEATSREDILDLLPDIKAFEKTAAKPKSGYDAIFDIEYLHTYMQKKAEFQRRSTYDHYLKAQHKCSVCFQVFRGPLALDAHVQTYHDEREDGQFCPICRMRILGSSKRNKHSQTHFAVYRCKLCPHVTYYRNTMKEHADKHKGKLYRCEPCDVSYKCASAYYKHMSRYHRRERAVCSSCGRGFPSARSLQVHVSLTHQNSSPVLQGAGVRCEECAVTFPSRSVHEAHVRDVHAAPPDVQACTLPRRDAYSLPGYRPTDRSRAQPRVGPSPRGPRCQKCRVCNVARAGAGWLKAHFQREHPGVDMDALYSDTKLHLCDVCGVGTISLYALRDHMHLHTGARPYACDVCPKRFRNSVLLRNHRLHHFPPALPCERCGKRFKTKSNLYNHMKGHTGERSFKCHICSKGFISSGSRNEHVRGVHYSVRRARKGAREGAGGTGAAGKTRAKRGKRIASETDDSADSE